jgi:L-ascorbate metabolism protein UlaG (beta-lactamase superfamily)
MDVLHLAEKYPKIRFIFSKDCKMSPHFLTKHGFAPEVAKRIHYVGADEKCRVDDLNIETLRSTDAGVAFYVETNGAAFYHAGDLNDWHWDGAGDLINGSMRTNYRSQIRRLSGRKIHLAFVPADPRLMEHQFDGMNYFLEHTDADYVFPMHMWQDYSALPDYRKRISNAAMAERVVEIKHENQIFEILEE